MYGDRARIGLIIPSPNTIIEPEFEAMKPDGVSVHAARVLLTSGTIEALKRMDEDVEEAAKLLATTGVDIIALGCTTGSLVGGLGWDEELIRRIESATDIPATTTSTAVIRAFRELGISKIAVATPYFEELDRLERESFEARGINVVKMKGLSLDSAGMRRLSPEVTYNLACEVNTSEADAVFISCTNFKSITIIERLEKDLNKHVLSSNIATMWDVLMMLRISEPITGYGKLFTRL